LIKIYFVTVEGKRQIRAFSKINRKSQSLKDGFFALRMSDKLPNANFRLAIAILTKKICLR